MQFRNLAIILLGVATPTIASAQQPYYGEYELPILDEGNGQTHVSFGVDLNGDGYGLLSLRWNTPVAPQYLWSSSIYTFQWYQPNPPVWGYQDWPVTTTMTARDHGVDLEYSLYVPATEPDPSDNNPTYICCGYGYVLIDAIWIGEAPTTVMGYISINGGSGTGPWAPIPASPVPEPEGWALMIGGFGLVGSAWRRRRRTEDRRFTLRTI